MRARTEFAVLFVLLLFIGVVVPSVHGQGACSLRDFEGTYVSFDRGASVIIDLESQGVVLPRPGAPANPLAWVAPGIVPFVNIGEVTYTPDGEGEGFFWMYAGTAVPIPEPVPLHNKITELNKDCTGKFQYTLPNGATIVERFILFDNGRQYRSVPMSGGIPTLTWIGHGQRISRGAAPVNFCGPQTAHGMYLMTCENILRTGPYPDKAVADTLLLTMDVSMQGEYTGLLYERFGMTFVDERPVSGTTTVHPDCTLATTLHIQDVSGEPVQLRGVYFSEGKEFYAMGIPDPSEPVEEQGFKYSFCHGTRIGQ
jgi:hypothetical protein